MEAPQHLHIELLSDTTFARGSGNAGIVDIEIEHDDMGVPLLHGKTLHGLLRDTWLSMSEHFPDLKDAALRIFGPAGDLHETGILHVGTATLESQALEWIRYATRRTEYPVSPDHILHAFTTIRRQTSESRETGAPEAVTLRSSRVITRGLTLISHLRWLEDPTPDDLRCLEMAALGTRHAGWARNRGRGRLQLGFDGDVEQTRNLCATQQGQS